MDEHVVKSNTTDYVVMEEGILKDIKIYISVYASEDKIVVHPTIMLQMLNNPHGCSKYPTFNIKKG
jgi:hypothetical protein